MENWYIVCLNRSSVIVDLFGKGQPFISRRILHLGCLSFKCITDTVNKSNHLRISKASNLSTFDAHCASMCVIWDDNNNNYVDENWILLNPTSNWILSQHFDLNFNINKMFTFYRRHDICIQIHHRVHHSNNKGILSTWQRSSLQINFWKLIKSQIVLLKLPTQNVIRCFKKRDFCALFFLLSIFLPSF